MTAGGGGDDFVFASGEGPVGFDTVANFKALEADQIDPGLLCTLDDIDMSRFDRNTAILDLYEETDGKATTTNDSLIGRIVAKGARVGDMFQNDTAYRSSGEAAFVLANAGVLVDLPTNDDSEHPGLLIV